MKILYTVIVSMGLLWAQSVHALIPRATFTKPVRTTIRDCDRWDLLVVKFNEGTGVRLRDGQFVSKNNTDVSEIHQLLKIYPDVRIARLFQRPEAVYEAEKITGERRTGRELADLNLYYAFGPKDPDEAERLLADLNAMAIVETAYAEPIPALPQHPAPTLLPPLYVDSQDYLEASPIGVDAYAAWNEPGGRGENVQMVDVELAWVWSHQDLPAPFYEGGTQNPDQGYRDHGTAVMGEIAGLDNAFGITGIANQASVGGQAINIDDWPENVGSHFDLASAALNPGDVWLIELHGPGPGGAYIAMEWWQGNYDAIANSTAQGRICVEAAGNGSANLDDSIYEGKFDRNVRDSLAIVVGAGTPYAMEPEWFTNYGSRIDANGWGSGIYTTGYGDLYSSEGENLYYTSDFGGTSGASPMVVGVCCVAQSIYKQLTDAVLAPDILRAAITETGAPQPPPATQYIGPRPNLAALLEHEIFEVEGIYLDQDVYACDTDAAVMVRHPDASGSVAASIASDTEPAGEDIILAETEPGVFETTIMLTTDPPQSGDGMLSVSDGDTVTATYDPLMDTAVAAMDCTGPVITNVAADFVGYDSAIVSWQTDEPSSSIVYYGVGAPSVMVSDLAMVTDHSIVLEDLDDCTYYAFYVESHDAAGNMTVDDNGGANYGFTTLELNVLMETSMDVDPGWSYENQWAWGIPQGNEGDPSGGYTGDNVVGYNLAGDYTNNMPETYCTTQSIDCSTATEVFLSYYEWLGVESSTWDHASVDVSADAGGTWTRVWDHTGSSVSPTDWTFTELDISAEAGGFVNVQIRWVMGTTDGSVTYCGWNIDDVLVSYTSECTQPTPTQNPCINNGDVTLDGEITAGDAQLAFLIALGSYSPSFEEECAADCNGDTEVTAGDAQAIFLVALGSSPACVDPL